jgi:myo-inositol 2-dehydrogenase/D-chiro-inositol 1-dehydrogenase
MFRLGLVGGGRMGQTHLRALADSTAVRIEAVAEPYEQTARSLRDRELRTYATVADLLDAGGIDGVLVAAPSDQHASLVRTIGAAGLPVLCEKPCGLDAAEAQAAGEAADDAGILLQIGYWRRFVPELQALRGSMLEGDLGEVHLVACGQWDHRPPPARFRRTSGGIFVDMGVHEIDQIRWLTGEEVSLLSVSAFPRVDDPEVTGDVDSAQALLTLSAGTAATISLGRFFPGGDMVSAEVFGSGGHRRLDNHRPADGERAQLEALRRQDEAFARWATGGPAEGATFADAVAALEVAAQLSGHLPRPAPELQTS